MFFSHVTLIDTLVYYYLENNAKQLCVRTHTHARTHKYTHARLYLWFKYAACSVYSN